RERPNMLAANVIAGMDYVKLAEPKRAVPFLEHALELDPKNPEAHRALASCYLRQENFRGATAEFRQLASLDPDKGGAWFRLGHEYLDLSARLAYRGARLYPDSAWGHRFLGDLLFERSQWDDARKEYQKALAVEPRQAGLHTSLGQALLHGGHLENADSEFHAELELDSSYELAWLGLAELALRKRQAAAALKDVNQAWEASPEFLALEKEFPTIELTAESARTLLADLETLPESPAKHLLLASLYRVAAPGADRDREWETFQNQVRSRQTTSPAVPENEGACKAHRYSACRRWLEKQKTLSGGERLLLGRIEIALRQYDSAADELNQVAGHTKENAEASYWLARAYQALGAQAYSELEEAFPDSWRMHQLRGEAAALRKNYNDAGKEFRRAVEMRPEDPELHEALGELELDVHANQEARSELESALRLDPLRPRALYLLGRLYEQNREDEKAIPYLEKAARLEPDLSEASSLVGAAYMHLGRAREALPYLRNAAPFDHYGNVHYQLYVAYRKLGQAELAKKALARSEDLRHSSLEHDEAMIMGSPQYEDKSGPGGGAIETVRP
ncbi:MAG: tetratricopeptide repeat protein, partial [Acidobacteria bacterium]|nr:tetratricopeptide repeat protein [Acidobacteriota bacterium]